MPGRNWIHLVNCIDPLPTPSPSRYDAHVTADVGGGSRSHTSADVGGGAYGLRIAADVGGEIIGLATPRRRGWRLRISKLIFTSDVGGHDESRFRTDADAEERSRFMVDLAANPKPLPELDANPAPRGGDYERCDVQKVRLVRRPTRLLAKPQPLHRNGEVLSTSRGDHWVARSWDGPERLLVGWWDRGESFCRDYYQVGTLAGEKLWIFREITTPSSAGHDGAQNSTDAHFLHGYFD